MAKSKIWIYVFGIVLFLFFLKLNFWMPRFSDDYFRLSQIDYNFLPIFAYVKWAYFHWLGRVMTNFITCTLLWQGNICLYIFNILNSVISVLLFYIIFLITYSRRPKTFYDFIILLTTFMIVWFMMGGFGEAFFWKSAAITHVWALTAILAFIYPYKKLVDEAQNPADRIKNYFKNKIHKLKAIKKLNASKKTLANASYKEWFAAIAYFVIGLILGDTLEHVALTVFTLLLAAIIYLRFKHHPLPKWTLTGLIGYGLGAIALLLSPGEYVKIKKYTSQVAHIPPLTKRIVIRIESISSHFKFYLLIALALFIFIIIFDRVNIKKRLLWFLIFAGCAVTTALTFIATPINVPIAGRMAFASDIFMTIALVNLIPNKKSKIIARILFATIIIILGLFLLINMYYVQKCYHGLAAQEKARQQIIRSVQKQHKKIAILPAFVFPPNENTVLGHLKSYQRRVFTWDITSDKDYWVNNVVAKHYHLDIVRLKKI